MMEIVTCCLLQSITMLVGYFHQGIMQTVITLTQPIYFCVTGIDYPNLILLPALVDWPNLNIIKQEG